MNPQNVVPIRASMPLPDFDKRHRPEDDVREAAHDFIYALAEAFNAKDLDAIKALRKRISLCVEALTVIERMALDFMDRTER